MGGPIKLTNEDAVDLYLMGNRSLLEKLIETVAYTTNDFSKPKHKYNEDVLAA